jgi:hypothetical protein
MNSPAFRLVKLIAGLVLIMIAGGLFVIFTGSINVAEKMGGPPMAGVFTVVYWCIVLVLDLVFLGLILGGVKLAGFSWSVFGWIIIVVGLGVMCLGIWNHLDGPPPDYDSTRSDDRMPVPPVVNAVVYIWAGLTILGGLLLTALTSREVARKKEH